MIAREQALVILIRHTTNKNLVRHGLATEAAMRSMYRTLTEKSSFAKATEDKWGLVGLLHDGDWQETSNDPSQHTKKMVEWLKQAGETDQEIFQAILSHNFVHTAENPPKNKMEWAIYTCDELTGLIVAVALVMPKKKLSSVTIESVLKKFPTKSFAAGVNRDQIKMCQEKLGLPLPQFIEIVLKSMQEISNELDL